MKADIETINFFSHKIEDLTKENILQVNLYPTTKENEYDSLLEDECIALQITPFEKFESSELSIQLTKEQALFLASSLKTFANQI